MGSRAKHRLDINSTPDSHIPPHPLGRSVNPEPISNTQRMPPTVGACCDYEWLVRLDHQPAIRLQSCSVERVADQAICQIMGTAIDRTRPGNTEVGEPDATAVLNGRRPSNLEDVECCG
jgi:hypothetical protein